MIYLLYTRDDIPQDDVHNANAHYDAIVLKNNTNTDSDASILHVPEDEDILKPSQVCNTTSSPLHPDLAKYNVAEEDIFGMDMAGFGRFEEGQTKSVFVEIRSKNGKDIILGSMYKYPNVDITQFSTNLSRIVNDAQWTQGKHPPELILGMDHNMNLLNGASHPPTHKFMEDLMNLNLLPTVTRQHKLLTIPQC